MFSLSFGHTQLFNSHLITVVSYCQLSATLQTVSITVETYKTIEMGLEFLSYI